ncbi:hypothetical protein SKAU_G00290040 [Synaphobranchus kaupii]|uniref:Uncharacterized protein n=1 Tax=Synaphobranchus kaupii TaxID=118154 RepID=A0A9Q1ETI8_SYNKA|nr:hypothetical protein SKAU_G00290040 [Synaphobranchus kaupii]
MFRIATAGPLASVAVVTHDQAAFRASVFLQDRMLTHRGLSTGSGQCGLIMTPACHRPDPDRERRAA